jgi:hypothetical protein
MILMVEQVRVNTLAPQIGITKQANGDRLATDAVQVDKWSDQQRAKIRSCECPDAFLKPEGYICG